MLQWWTILNHAKEIIPDKHSKIIFTWYQAQNTLWWKIVAWEKRVNIDWEYYDVNAKKVFIWGYSAHIWQDDIVDFLWNKLKLSKKAKVALVHWLANRKELVDTILKVNNKINFIIPEKWDKIELDM